MTSTNKKLKSETIPAIDIPLTGKHLIEASAGTGKTWTLTGIVLRLLIETRRSPEQIIATTFTRAAAAEMRQRINDRLVDFYQILNWLKVLIEGSSSADIKQRLYPEALLIIPQQNTEDARSKNISKEQKEKVRDDRRNWLLQQARHAHIADKLDEPVNFYLVEYLLDNTYSYKLDDAIRRTALVLTTLDNLFVGTLDSLAQKWLTEYSSETGHQQGMAIIDDNEIDHVVDSSIHDELRQFQSRMYYEQPDIYDLLQDKGKLTDISAHKASVIKALTFVSAPIDEVIVDQDFSLNSLIKLINQFSTISLSAIEPYFNHDFLAKNKFRKGTKLWENMAYISEIQLMASKYGINFTQYLSDEALKLYEGIAAAHPNADGKIVGFNKGSEKQHQTFINLPIIKSLKAIQDSLEQLEQYLDSTIKLLNQKIATTVRQKLPAILEERGQTTFTLQMVRLNQALSGSQGQKLARYIHHHYPVALIDESQDVNGEQALMIERIYLPKNTNSPSNKVSSNTKSFLLLVGDPKQAIYGFRGGDVTNYNEMKRQFGEKQIHTLNVNRRSNVRLIEALNHWFGKGSPTATNSDKNVSIFSKLGNNIYYKYIEAANDSPKVSWLTAQSNANNKGNDVKQTGVNPTSSSTPSSDHHATRQSNSTNLNSILPDKPVSLIHLPYDKDRDANIEAAKATAQHIATLLNSGHLLDGKAIKPSDIGVLGRKKDTLKRVEDELVKLGVPTLITSEVSIFETIVAEDVASLMSAMLYPYRNDMINRVLTSQLYGFSIAEVKAMRAPRVSQIQKAEALNSSHTDISDKIITDNRYQDFITHLKQGAKHWHKRGILSALHYVFDNRSLQLQGVWQLLAQSKDGERHIMDLRHIMDILAQHGSGMGEYELLAWYKQNMATAPSSDWAKQQPLPTESGVQLMTIHKSKGLEFPVAYVLGMDAASRKPDSKKHDLYLYNTSDTESPSTVADKTMSRRRLSPVIGTKTNESYYGDIVESEDFDELKRLGYVAFTRASEQLYIVLTDANDKRGYERKPVFYWFDTNEKTYELPARLRGKIGVVRAKDITNYQETAHFNSKHLSSSNSLDNTNINLQNISKLSAPKRIQYQNYDDVMKKKRFSGWAKTSFTALARQLDDSVKVVAINDERIDDDIDLGAMDLGAIDLDSLELGNIGLGDLNTPINSEQTGSIDNISKQNYLSATDLKTEDNIRFRFVKGANPGTFLHEVFEKIDFTDSSQWSQIIDRAIGSYQLPITYASQAYQLRQQQLQSKRATVDINDEYERNSAHHQLQQWIKEVLHVPLLASNQSLVSIPAKQRFAELGFNMGLSEDFEPQQINELFTTYLPDDPDKHVRLGAKDGGYLYRYLRGEIDLVYQCNNKYYVVDYKSNFLGSSISDYTPQALNKAMNKAGYWLQAAIYQVALHRFLSLRIPDYQGNEEKYLGAVEYVFLRGTYCLELEHKISMNNKYNDINDSATTYGLITWDIPIEFVKALDKLFGRPN